MLLYKHNPKFSNNNKITETCVPWHGVLFLCLCAYYSLVFALKDDVLVLVLRVNVLVWPWSWHWVSQSWGLVLWCYYCYHVALCGVTISGAAYIHAGLVLPHWTLVIVLNCICMCLQFLYCMCLVW